MKPANCLKSSQSYRPIRWMAVTILFFLSQINAVIAQLPQSNREAYLKESLLINEPRDHRHAISLRVSLQDSTWIEWQKRTGELPPAFDEMKSNLNLPEPLEWQGKEITNNEQWQQKRGWIKEQYQYWVSGHRPPAPDNIQPTILEERFENDVHIQVIRLNFGPSGKAKMTFEVMIPPGKGPFPVYMTQWNHRNWAQLALRRGYIACVYAGADDRDDTQDYQHLYPEYDFTCLMRRAWGASRVVDYLVTRQEVDKEKIAITGHSRNGKQSLWAAAFDKRFAAVVSSSCGTGGVTPFRYSDPQYCTQTIDDITSNAAHWFQPRLRFFFGREDRLPIDQNLLLSLIAPRALLIHYAIVEQQISPWATEQCYQSVKKVYSFLHADKQIGILPRMGEHPVATRDLERCLDFLDIQFKRSKTIWDNRLYYTYCFDDWKKKQDAEITYNQPAPEYLITHQTVNSFEKQQKKILNNLNWLLGEEPPGVRSTTVDFTSPSRLDCIDLITGRPDVRNAHNWRIGPYTAMNDHLSGYLYCPDTTQYKNIPVIIYLHPYAHAHGSAFGYNSFNAPDNQPLFQKFIDNGFAVLSIDMVGFGTRIEEGAYFYDRFPQWSKMGRMIADVKACIDAVSFFPFLNRERVFVVGNTLGGTVGLLAAATDKRIAGAAVVSGMSAWRSAECPYSLKSLSHLHGLIPRLGFWAEQSDQAPIDLPELIACIAPRPLLLIAPSLDKYIRRGSVKQTAEKAGKIYSLHNKREKLQLSEPEEINRLTNAMSDSILFFFKKQL